MLDCKGQHPLKQIQVQKFNNIPFVTRYCNNVNNNEKVKKIRRKFNNIQSDHLKNVFKSTETDRTIETEIYYKDTNAHDYLPYGSTHPDHSKDNVPYNLAKRIIVFVSNEQKIEYRLMN